MPEAIVEITHINVADQMHLPVFQLEAWGRVSVIQLEAGGRVSINGQSVLKRVAVCCNGVWIEASNNGFSRKEITGEVLDWINDKMYPISDEDLYDTEGE